MGLTYTFPSIEGKIRISPSSFYMLFDNPAKWYRQTILGQKDGVNTNLVFGTLIHNRIERFFNKKDIDISEEDEYRKQFKDAVEVNEWEIDEMLEPMWEVILEHFSTLTDIPIEVEQSLIYEPKSDNCYISGTYDYRTKDTIGDYKTTNSKQSGIKTHHKLQLLVYAFLLQKQGIAVDNIEVTYIVKPKQLKTKYNPAIVQVFREQIEQEDMDFVINQLKLLVKRIDMCSENKELVELFFYTNPLAHF